MTPIKQAKNIGPITAKDLVDIGVITLEDLQEKGWQEVLLQLLDQNPKHQI